MNTRAKVKRLPKLAIPVYLANPYSSKLSNKDQRGLQQTMRRLLESYVGGVLKKKYKNKYCFLLPIAMSASMAEICDFDTGFSTWKTDDLTWISICQEVWVLMSEGWKESEGVQAEIAFAKKLGKPVRYIELEALHAVHS